MKLLTPIERLPDRPSYLIRSALLDIADCERDRRYATALTFEERKPRWRPARGFGGGAWNSPAASDDRIYTYVLWNEDDFLWDFLWHSLQGEVCAVCMAGAVMAKSCFAPWGEDLTPDNFDADTRKKLMALDALRQGHVHRALITILDLGRNPIEVERRIIPYAQHRPSFFRQMGMLADDLEAHDL
jgi:hypothetical protein